ncbi:hypothetical protein [Burkholderia sp. Ac-20379]|uniref:hypothetical protein n=1 Tax=Burkholderia sp. Ac-20379 TaxID=2703900 RepID=UPI00198246C5|nr:hypothetical protein [Burkholderia sp. Ac-20379]MBN3725059.1 hypothetical protein [Burkholderia sp. Ac-20379]
MQHLLQDVSLIVKKNLPAIHAFDTIFVFPAHFRAAQKWSMLSARDGSHVSIAGQKMGRGARRAPADPALACEMAAANFRYIHIVRVAGFGAVLPHDRIARCVVTTAFTRKAVPSSLRNDTDTWINSPKRLCPSP